MWICHYRPGSMAYSPGLKKGQPGKIIMDPDASYSAWLHEMRHMEDDQAAGWMGMAAFGEKSVMIEFEERAYDTEIDFARRHGYNNIIRRLERLKFERRQEILGIQRNNRQPHA